MRILQIELTHAEAADPAVIRSIQTLVAMQQAEGSAVQIGGEPSGNALPPPAPLHAVAGQQSTVLEETTDQKAARAFGAAQAASAPTTPPADYVAPGTTPTGPSGMPPAPPAPAGLREVDAAGWPWDARIHSEPPSKTEKGIWRASRKAGASALRPQVEAELRALGYGVVNPPPAPAPVQQPGLTPEQQGQLLAAQVQQQAQQQPQPQPPAPPAPMPAAGAAPSRTFEALMMRVQAGVQGKILNHDWLKVNYLEKGVPSIMALMQAPGVIDQLHQSLDVYEIPDHVKG